MKPKSFDTYQNRVAQFEQSEYSNKAANSPKAVKTVKALDTSNPYLQARNRVLKDYPVWRRSEIENMERLGNINNKHYANFVHDVAVLGDTLMPI